MVLYGGQPAGRSRMIIWTELSFSPVCSWIETNLSLR